MRPSLPSLFAVLSFFTSISAHPGEDHTQEAAARRSFLQHSKRDLSHCDEHLQARGLKDQQIAHRHELARSLRTAEGLDKRALSDIQKTHHSEEHYTLWTSAEILFSSNNSCVLSPETIEGPYYVGGEYIRKDLAGGQKGVPMFVQTQVIDINTCEPIPGIYVEIWSANATGVYSGVVASGNGDGNDNSNINETFARGIQPTDAYGSSLFKTIFPGHYSGRTPHIHTIAHTNATLLPNGTIMNTVASHVGQIFFDQDLIYEVEALPPYTQNTQVLTLNSNDSILATSSNGSDPIMEWVYLGEDVSDGILAWLAFGVDQTFADNVTAAAYYYKDGGVINQDAEIPSGPPL